MEIFSRFKDPEDDDDHDHHEPHVPHEHTDTEPPLQEGDPIQEPLPEPPAQELYPAKKWWEPQDDLEYWPEEDDEDNSYLAGDGDYDEDENDDDDDHDDAE